MDDFNFDLEPSQTVEPTPETPAAPEAQPAIDPNEVAQLRSKVQSFEKWQQDAARFFAGQPPQQQPDPQAFLQQFVQDPTAVLQQTAQQAAQLARQEMETQAVIQKMHAEFPHMVPFQSAIEQEIPAAVQAFHQKNGRPPSFEEAVRTAIDSFNGKLQGYQAAITNQQTANTLRNQALPLTPGNPAQPNQGIPNVAAMNSEEFAAYRAKKLSESYQV